MSLEVFQLINNEKIDIPKKNEILLKTFNQQAKHQE